MTKARSQITPATKAKILLAYLRGGGCRAGAANRNTNAAYMVTFIEACTRFAADARGRRPAKAFNVRVHVWQDGRGAHLAVAVEPRSSYILAWAAHPTERARACAALELQLKPWPAGSRFRSAEAFLPPLGRKTRSNRLPLAVALASVHRNHCALDPAGTTPAMRFGVAEAPLSEEALVLAVLGLADKVAIVPEASAPHRTSGTEQEMVLVYGRMMPLGELAMLAETTPERIRLGMRLGKSAEDAAFKRFTFADSLPEPVVKR